jgi:hypothetical protein
VIGPWEPMEPPPHEASDASGDGGTSLARGLPVLPFGPYAGLGVADVARLDPGHLLALVREGIGDAELRAAAAQVLARHGAAGGGLTPIPGPSGTRGPSDAHRSAVWRLAPWLLGAGLGVAALRFGEGRSVSETPVPAGDAAATMEGYGAAPAGAGAAGSTVAAATIAGAAPPAATEVPDPGGVDAAGGLPAPTSPPGPGPNTGGDGATSAAVSGAAIADAGASGVATAPPGSYEPDAPCGARASGAVPAADASAHLDRFAAVEFPVMGAKDTGKVTFLNSHAPYQGHFYVAIFPDLYGAFPQPPASLLPGRCVVVQGRVEAYRGVPQIVLRDAADLRDLGPAGPPPGSGAPEAAPGGGAAP